MKKWLYLAGAIVFELVGTMSLRASVGEGAWFALTAFGYVTAFYLLFLALQAGMSIAVAYGLWGALGVALTAVLGTAIFQEPLSSAKILGIVVITAGVLLVEFGARQSKTTRGDDR